MLKPPLFLLGSLLWCSLANAQVFQRELGDFDLKLGTTPSRSMAQGLVKPSATGSFHGGLDLSHDSGFYAGQWSPSMGLSAGNNLEVDSYMGFKHPFDQTLGYEVGLIHYSYPKLSPLDSQEFYGGLNLLGNRFGASFSNDPDRQDSTLFADLGQLPLLDADFTVKLAHHRLGTPFTIGDGSQVSAFSDWSLELSRPWLGIDLNLIYSNSNLSGSGCDAYAGINAYCESVVTFKAQRSFF